MVLKRNKSLKSQIKTHTKKQKSQKPKYEGNDRVMISTGSTLLDLAIGGTRKKGGGIPSGILIEAFGPESSGKTVLLCEIGGAIQRQGGVLLFNDPEARLNQQFASIFGIDMNETTLINSDTVSSMFKEMEGWQHGNPGKINGLLVDSLAALSTDMEMENKDGDKMGMRRAKELSEGWRKFARKIKQENYIVVCSNQIRVKTDAMAFGEQFTTPGGRATAFYASLRLKFNKPVKIQKEVSFKGNKIKKPIGTEVSIEVYKSSVDRPYRKADVIIDFVYGIDDVKANLIYLKKYSNKTVYHTNKRQLNNSLEKSIQFIEENNLEKELRESVIEVWEMIEEKFEIERKKKQR